MISSICAFLQAVLVLSAIGTGATVVFGFLTRHLHEKWAVTFLRFSLAASVIGLVVPFHQMDHITAVKAAFMLSVYMAGVVILASRRYRLAGVWCSIFTVTTTLVLYLNVAVAVSQVFRYVSVLISIARAPSEETLLITQSLLTAVFVGLAILAVIRFHTRPTHRPIPLVRR